MLAVRTALAVLLLLSGRVAWAAEWTLEFHGPGGPVSGTPLAWSTEEITLLARDGQLLRLATRDAQRYRKVSDVFRSFSSSEMKGRLLTEFGSGFEVTATSHYLVVHAAGQRDQWAQRFESFHRAFVHYFSVRGWRVPEPRFPLVAVVFPTQSQYFAHARATNVAITKEVLGYYSPISNRILMYDLTNVHPGAQAATFETVVHESAHQTAFNTGMHDRLRPPPRWLIEGLGTLFEARGVWDPRGHPNQLDRINAYRLERFQAYLPRRARGSLLDMIATDRLFETDPDAAYAEAWAFSFFLAETRPKQYVEYLQRTAHRTGEPVDQVQEFAAVFGANLQLLETHYLRFLGQHLRGN